MPLFCAMRGVLFSDFFTLPSLPTPPKWTIQNKNNQTQNKMKLNTCLGDALEISYMNISPL